MTTMRPGSGKRRCCCKAVGTGSDVSVAVETVKDEDGGLCAFVV
jgi:hypothetical protein